jgi:hypothetical protein
MAIRRAHRHRQIIWQLADVAGLAILVGRNLSDQPEEFEAAEGIAFSALRRPIGFTKQGRTHGIGHIHMTPPAARTETKVVPLALPFNPLLRSRHPDDR